VDASQAEHGRVTQDDTMDGATTAPDDDGLDPMFAPERVDPVVDLLAKLAGDGRALELGIGTGRIALPLSQRGVPVHGIDLSGAAVEQLRKKPGAMSIGVTIGDFAAVRVDGTFRVVYLVFNTIMNLTAQAGQVACFRNAAAHLDPGGAFLVEVMVPDLRRLPPGERFVVFDASERHWGIDEYDVVEQGLVSHHFQAIGDRIDRSSGPFRYVWPSELDLMAELAGMRLRARWGGWQREPFTSESRMHVSIWEKPTP
jgi:SAM-dependent methyltransferase